MTRIFNLGIIGTVHRGGWSATETYNFLNTVYSTDGTLYLCINADGAPAGALLSNTVYWKVYIPRWEG